MIQPPVLNVFNIDQTSVPVNHVHPFFEHLLESFTIPRIGSQVTARVKQSAQYQIGMWIWINGAGFFRVTGIPDGTHLYVINDGISQNNSVGTIVVPFSVMMPTSQPDINTQSVAFDLYDQTTEVFVAPSGAVSSAVYLENLSSWGSNGMHIYIDRAGVYKIIAVDPVANRATVVNADGNNLAAGSSLAAGALVWPIAKPSLFTKSGTILACNPTLSTNDETIGTVTFTVPFVVAPAVSLSFTPASALGAILTVYADTVTKTGFTVKQSCGAIADVNIDVHWIASVNGNL